jgi:hypothetical protein
LLGEGLEVLCEFGFGLFPKGGGDRQVQEVKDALAIVDELVGLGEGGDFEGGPGLLKTAPEVLLLGTAAASAHT